MQTQLPSCRSTKLSPDMVRLGRYFQIGEGTFSVTWSGKFASYIPLKTMAYHPQTDGLVERLNSTLCQTLSMFVSKNQKDWDIFTPAALFAFRTSPCESTGDSPFYLLCGREPRLPMEVTLLSPGTLLAEHCRRAVRNIKLAQQIARDNIARTQHKMKEYYDRSARDPNYVEGSKA